MTTLMTGVTTDVDGAEYAMQDAQSGNRTAVVQASYDGGTGNVLIQGRLNSNHDWTTLTTLTATAPADEVSVFPRMRAKTDSLSSATVVVDISARGVAVSAL